MDENERKQAQTLWRMQSAALVILVDRAGGTFTYTETEYQAVLAKYGGKTKIGLHVEASTPAGGGEPSVELTLEQKAPRNAELPV